MPSPDQLPMILGCALASTIVLYILSRSMMDSVQLKTVLLAAVLMTLAGLVRDALLLPVWAEWAGLIVVCFVIVRMVFDSTAYFAALATAVWIGIQMLFYNYLAGGGAAFVGAS